MTKCTDPSFALGILPDKGNVEMLPGKKHETPAQELGGGTVAAVFDGPLTDNSDG